MFPPLGSRVNVRPDVYGLGMAGDAHRGSKVWEEADPRSGDPEGMCGRRRPEAAGEGDRAHNTQSQKEKANHVPMTGLYFMPATTYSPTHFRVQYHRPCGA